MAYTMNDFTRLAAERDALEITKQTINDEAARKVIEGRLAEVNRQLDAAADELTRNVPTNRAEVPFDDEVPMPEEDFDPNWELQADVA